MLSACGGDAVVFAPTPAPPEASPLPYTHPGGAFSITVPRRWSRYEQNAPTLAAASFSAPGETEPSLSVAVIRLDAPPDDTAFAALIERYQTQIRPDLDGYAESERAPMGDGSWRAAGRRSGAGGVSRVVNTFMQIDGALFAVTEILLPDDGARLAQLQAIANTLTLHGDAALEASDPATLAAARPYPLSLLHISAWTGTDGAFFITGEVANAGGVPLMGVPVEAQLITADGVSLLGALDVAMGYALAPGGFAPFSLRFGGQPPQAADYVVRVGGDVAFETAPAINMPDELAWTDDATYDAFNQLAIVGEVTNTGTRSLRQPRAFVTVFDEAERVIAAGMADADAPTLAPGARAAFTVTLPQVGGDPVNYIVQVQALAGE